MVRLTEISISVQKEKYYSDSENASQTKLWRFVSMER
jgi:hypothetical protein